MAMENDVQERDHSLLSFTQDTSLHGLKYVTADARLPRRLFWAIAVVLMGAVLTYMLCAQLVLYWSYPFLTKYSTGAADTLEFPAVTICNLNGISTKNFTPDERLRNYLYDTGKLGIISEAIDWNDTFYDWVMDEAFVKSVSTDLNTLIYIAYWQGNPINVTDFFTPRITYNGICYTFNDLTTNNKEEGLHTRTTGNLAGLVLSMNVQQQYYYYGRFNMAAGAKVILHDPRDEPDVMSLGFTLSPGYTSYVAMRHEKRSHLGKPYRAFKDEYCVKTSKKDFRNHLQYYRRYSHQGCLMECLTDFMLSTCGCRLNHLPGNASVCNLRQSKECAIPNNEIFFLDPTHKKQCDCPKPCEAKAYRTELSVAYFPADGVLTYWGDHTDVRKNFLELRLFYQELEYDHVEQIPEYTLEGILANLGGQMGLFLGASVLTATELIEFIFIYAILVFKKLSQRASQTRVQEFKNEK